MKKQDTTVKPGVAANKLTAVEEADAVAKQQQADEERRSAYAVMVDKQGVPYLRVAFTKKDGAFLILNTGKEVQLIEMDLKTLKSRAVAPVPEASVLDAARILAKPITDGVTVAPKAAKYLETILNDKELVNMANSKKAKKSAKAAAKGAAPKKAAAAKTNGEARGRAAAFADDAKITVLAKENPGREGTKRREWFDLYKKGTVGAYIKAGGDRGYLTGDVKRGLIKIA